MRSSIRFLCLGKDLLADSALDFAAAGELRRRWDLA
jgi:hypothetical protein